MAKKNYYNIANLLKTEAEYMMLLGQRANGKSYQVKKTVLEDAIKGIKFVYLRRYKADIHTKAVEDYFSDMPLEKITKEYNTVYARSGYIYLYRINNEGVVEKKLEIGRYCALNEYERYKSQVFKDTKHIIFEEFITDAYYLVDEPRLLQQFVSTVLRLNKGHVFLIGNTLSRVCPYFKEWSLEGVLKQKQGTIDIYKYHVNDTTVKIAVEYCASTNNTNTMFFGQSAKQILGGEWDVHDYPKLPRRQYEYDKVYELMFVYQAFKFVIELLVEPKNGGKLLFIYPLTKDRKIYRIIQDDASDLPNVSPHLDLSKRPEAYIRECLILNKAFFSDNLTGSDFAKCRELLLNC